MSEANPTDPRVLVAQDVLALLDAKKIIAKRMTYVSDHGQARKLLGDREEAEVRDLFRAFKKPCNVCIRGALFLAEVDRFDACKLRRQKSASLGPLASGDYESQVFKDSELETIEAAFEEWKREEWKRDEKGIEDSPKTNPDLAMRRICQSIIDNGGEFKP